MATMDTAEPVNLARSIFICNLFNFFFAASKICIIPFLTLYLKLLGLSATETGIVIGGKTLSAFFFAPFWASCAMRCRKRRLVLMFALFMMAATYLSLTLIPGVNNSNGSCRSALTANQSQSLSGQDFTTSAPGLESLTGTPRIENGGSNMNVSEGGNASEIVTTPIMITTKHPDNQEDEKLLNGARDVLKKIGISAEKVDGMDRKALFRAFKPIMESEENREILVQVVSDEQWQDLQKLFGGKMKRSVNISSGRQKRESFLAVWERFKLRFIENLQQIKETAKVRLFSFVLVILVVGEIFCSPVEKIADDSWFEFLEKIDDLEKYGKHRIWCSLASIIFPVILTLIVDNTDCLFGLSLHPFMLHFYVFGGLLGLTFLIGFYFPIPDSEKTKYKSKLLKGFGMTCCRCGGILYILTLLVMGIIYASYSNYLFWVIQDLHGPESAMGMCITIAAFAEIPMLYFSKLLVNKIGNGGVIAIALICLSARTMYYSYLWTPWAVLPAELTHAFTHTAMWFAVLSNPAFSINPTVDRSIRSILSSMYFGVGFATGSFASGFIYDQFGAALLYRTCAVIAIAWCPVYFVLQRCCYRPAETEIKYSRLLQAEDFESDEDDDWLEHALKDR